MGSDRGVTKRYAVSAARNDKSYHQFIIKNALDYDTSTSPICLESIEERKEAVTEAVIDLADPLTNSTSSRSSSAVVIRPAEEGGGGGSFIKALLSLSPIDDKLDLMLDLPLAALEACA